MVMYLLEKESLFITIRYFGKERILHNFLELYLFFD